MRRLNNKGMATVAIVGIIALILFMLLLLPAVLFASETENDGDGTTCTGGDSAYQYTDVYVTRYGPECPGCTGNLKGKTDYFQKKINDKKVTYKPVNVLSANENYAPRKWPDVFREVKTDPILKAGNTSPALVEFNDDDYGWVKIVAMQESNTGVKPAKGYKSGSILRVALPGDKIAPFLVIIGDTGGKLKGFDEFKANKERSTTIDLLTLKNDVNWLSQVFSPDYNTEGGNVTIDVLRVGYKGEASECSTENNTTISSKATASKCTRNGKTLDYNFNGWNLTAAERDCLSKEKFVPANPKTIDALMEAISWLLLRPKVPYSMQCRIGVIGWNEGWGTSCGSNYPYKGLDCSSFTSWAFKNAGYAGIDNWSSGIFSGSDKFVTITNKQPQVGDILVAPPTAYAVGHVSIIVNVKSKTKVDIVETNGWNQSGDANRSVHRRNNVTLSYKTNTDISVGGSSKRYRIRRIKGV